MKSAKHIISILIFVLMVSSCKETRLVDYTNMYIHNNLWYYNDETVPFTGTSYFNFFGDSSVVDYDKGRWDGRFIIYYANGNIDTERNYRQDVLHGRYYKGSMEGKTLVKGQYRNGKMHGTWYYYEPNGKLKEKIVY
jgi:antitoxin component YwqK of YwqJK toxin-antitoxin module